MTSPAPSYHGYRFPPEIISHAVWLYIPLLSQLPRYRGSAGPARDHGHRRDDSAVVSDVWARLRAAAAARTRATGRRLVSGRAVRKYSGPPSVSLAGRGPARRRHRYPRAVATRPRGRRAFLLQVVEGTRPGAAPADHGQAAQLCRSAPHRDAVGGAQHAPVRNNRAEVSHQPTRYRERQMRRFTSATHAQRFLSVQGVVLHLFRVGRHLLRAAHHRLLRTRAFGVWREATCV